MKVIFRNAWFAPSAVRKPDKIQVMSGQLFRKSDEPQDVPDEFRSILPSSAKVVGEAAPAPKLPLRNAMREADIDRAAAEAMPEDKPLRFGLKK
jgi:hypothetical protein